MKFIQLAAALSVALLPAGCASDGQGGDGGGMQLFQQVVGIASMAVGTVTKNDNLTNQGQNLLNQSLTPTPAPYSPPPQAEPTPSGAGQVASTSQNPNGVVFRVKSMHPNVVDVVFYSKSRPAQWPPVGRVYSLSDSQFHDHDLACNVGEKICYGAWVRGTASSWWGVGRGGTQACQNCCRTCGSGTHEITLNP